MDKDTVRDIIKDAAAEIALGAILRYGRLNDLSRDQQKQLDEAARSVAEVVMADAFEPFLILE